MKKKAKKITSFSMQTAKYHKMSKKEKIAFLDELEACAESPCEVEHHKQDDDCDTNDRLVEYLKTKEFQDGFDKWLSEKKPMVKVTFGSNPTGSGGYPGGGSCGTGGGVDPKEYLYFMNRHNKPHPSQNQENKKYQNTLRDNTLDPSKPYIPNSVDDQHFGLLKEKKDLYDYYKNKKRDWLEAYIDLHNRKFELLRTISSLLAVIMNAIVLLKIFGKI